MDLVLKCEAEIKAKAAEVLPCFSGLNLLHIKREVSELLRLIGSNGIFDEYTKHDISHIEAMLRLLTDLIIPKSSQDLMTPADWLLIVLSVYFHDIGMLVTKREFRQRHESHFPQFVKYLLEDSQGKEYESKLARLPEDERDRFLYQEFVRSNHAKRVRDWIINDQDNELGVSTETAAIINTILSPLGDIFREDLGLICESHHLDNLDDFDIYKTSKPYGMSEDETANLHYAALLLRTADLLHISSDRTPSVVFKTISPTDPLSQREWAKQMAVRSIRQQVPKDEDGKERPDLDRNTIEVHATFTDENGFFGLTSYLDYAERELKQTSSWADVANKMRNVKFALPWAKIDQQYIETRGFLKEQFEFKIDTFRILELLTGHTLYNETGVVLRELVQNSIDAVRLQHFDHDRSKSRSEGRVQIHWDSIKRILRCLTTGPA